jgi:DNA-binding CsgD family transcriptional regulator
MSGLGGADETPANPGLLDRVERLTHAAIWTWDPDAGRLHCSDALRQLVGLETSGSLSLAELLDRVHPADQLVLRREAESVRRGREPTPLRVSLIGRDGRPRCIEIAAEWAGANGRGRPRVVGVARDVTEEWRAAKRTKLRRTVSKVLSEWTTLADSGPRLLQAMTSTLTTAVATLWEPDGDVLEPRLSWVTDDLTGRRLADAANRLRVRRGTGVAGWAWELGEPVDGGQLPAGRTDHLHELARRAGFTTALAIPAVAGPDVLAVIEIHARDRTRITELSRETMRGLSYELGGVLLARRHQRGRNPLTTREGEILELAADGLTTAQIADRLVVERSTVRTHFQHIYAKLGTPDRAAAVAYALRQGLIA